jgi:hypothetical protein
MDLFSGRFNSLANGVLRAREGRASLLSPVFRSHPIITYSIGHRSTPYSDRTRKGRGGPQYLTLLLYSTYCTVPCTWYT